MPEERKAEKDWSPLTGSYEESVLSWHEQIEVACGRADRARREEIGHCPEEAEPGESPTDAL
jgi:hypothetical protein